MDGQRIRDWLVGRHEFRGLVVVDPEIAKAHGGRPIPGTKNRAEFVQVATGPRARARIDAAKALHAWVATEMPGARLEALLDGGPPAVPAPRLRLVRGGRLGLMLVNVGEAGDKQEEQLDSAVAAWGLSRDQVRLHPPLDDHEWRMRLLSVVVGVGLGAPLTILLFLRAAPDSSSPDAALLPQLAEGNILWLVAALAPATLPVVFVSAQSGRLAIWPVRGRLIAAAFAIGPAVLVAVYAAILDGITWFGERYPGPAAIVLGLVGIGVSPFLALAVEGRWWRGVLGWGLPLLVGGIMVFAGDVSYDLYLEHFDISRSDVTVSLVQQWAMGALVTSVLLLGVYSGVAAWAVGRRFVGRSLIGETMTGLYLIILLVIIVLILLVALERRVEINENGLPTGLIGLEPRLACVVPVNGPYSYVGQPIEPTAGPVVYFGRADGRLAVWSARSGGVLLDAQAVGLRFVQPGSTCG